jgi:hypothetical protein
MLISVFGTPTPLTRLVADILQAFAEETMGCAARLEAKTADELNAARDAHASGEAMAIALCMPAVDETVDACRSGQIPAIAVAEGLAKTVQSIVETTGLDFLSAARLATNPLSTLEPLFRDGRFLCVTPKDLPLRPEALLDAIAGYLQCPCSEDQKKRILAKVMSWPATASTAAELSAAEKAMLEILAGGYDTVIHGQGMQTALWPRAVFSTVVEPVNGVIDLTGPARCLTFGPYFHLPRGHFRATIEIEVAGNFSQNRMGVDIYNGRLLLAIGDMTLPPSGVYEFALEFEVTDTASQMEIRLFLRTGAIEGQLLLRVVSIEPIATPAPKKRKKWNAPRQQLGGEAAPA